ncbi:MAG: LptF/LptG family permease [Bacteroidetes bacterium]|nr:LptF/LptG family permease [Bacteroidota bacterium]
MRTLNRYIIFSYIGPFLMTFFIAVFVLFLQFLWKYVDDLIGKGLETRTLVELFFYAALSMFPLALPLAILLSSLMTFGNLGEQFELVALKSSGISLQKIMFPLILVAFLTSVGAFFFSNNMLPFINLKMRSLIYDIQQKKPALNIKEGVFYNGIDGYTIRVEKKDDDGTTCHDIMIYDHTQNAGNNKVITAESGNLEMTPGKEFLIIQLFNGTSYEEMTDSKGENNYPLVRSKFKEQTVRFDLSGLRLVRSEEELFKSSYEMLNLQQIEEMIDSTITDKEKRISDFKKNFGEMLSENKIFKTSTSQVSTTNPSDTSRHFSNSRFGMHRSPNVPLITQNTSEEKMSKERLIDMALTMARSKKYYIESLLGEMENYDRPIIKLKVEWHKKFTLSIACLILFFVGAPLGAIIRKGGLGMPVVVSVIIFILFWVVTITGEKMSEEGALPPYLGMWIATVVTLPLGIFLTRKATSDSALFDTDSYLRPFQKLFRKRK